MKLPRTLAAVAVLLGLALCGCQAAPGPPTPGLTSAVPSPPSAELAAMIQTAVEDRNSTVLDTLQAPRLADRQTTAACGAKRGRDLPVVERSKARFRSAGFWYTSFSTKVTVESIEVTGSTANVHFKEQTEEYLASTANGPSSVPSGYSSPQTATFRASADGWQLDSIDLSEHGGGLPMSIVES
ncbi:hypothetical protein [Arthrobacter sp. 2MCAF14]|uniref:hypothetical protein n=1 Tax=Arthrobacter sp. 2MCAF14 TaxID=3232982 RepID=UPI003F8DD9A2